ncbi:MAG: pentapeptide repeat-containing protein, partial [Acidobacteria bacterium]|nr:pentapeptide repeat-containing protein [Acidobacteriota bacterium]
FNRVHDGFVEKLRLLLSDSKTAEKFEPLKNFLELGNAEKLAHIALATHAEYQREQYETAPVFRFEPFALKDVYVETECGVLDWQEIREKSPRREMHEAEAPDRADRDFSPFNEKYGGRHNLVETVMGFIRNPKFHDPIVLQGDAGAGKSSFTIRLSAELLSEGFCPIRVRLKHLQLGKPLLEALPDAIELGDEDRLAKNPLTKPKDLLLGGRIFNERYGTTDLCRYVLILDGWDELSLSDNRGFRENVQDMLKDVRDTFFRGSDNARVRVIITGRPSEDVIKKNDTKDGYSYFLTAATKVLTLRPMRPDQLRDLTARMKTALETQPIYAPHTETAASWQIPDLTKFEPVFKTYEETFAEKRSQRLEVLGSPLLAYLAIRVMAETEGDLTKLINQPTRLYRELTNLTCGGAGKFVADKRDKPGERDAWWRTDGAKLRQLLQRTAAAMTINGKEYISKDQLARRVFDGEDDETDDVVGEAGRESTLSKLMISFFFKGGHPELGCEFSHKSFREYLTAERIVEVLKEFGRASNEFTFPKRPKPERDFPANDDPRYEFSRELSRLLAPQWLKQEVINHLEEMLRWEIQRSRYGTGSVSDLSLTTDASAETQVAHAPRTASPSAATFHQWEQIRDGLADLWEWWVNGAHLRPQWENTKGKKRDIEPAFVHELIKWSAPLDEQEAYDQSITFEPATTMDAHLGDGLFRLCAWVHFFVAEADGWLAPREEGKEPTPEQLWAGVSAKEVFYGATGQRKTDGEGKPPHSFQASITQGNRQWRLFAPSGENNNQFFSSIARVNSATDLPTDLFPARRFIKGIDLKGASLYGAILDGAILDGAILDGAGLDGAILDDASLDGARLNGASLDRASLDRASLDRARLNGASLDRASLDRASLNGASLNQTQLRSADLRNAINLTKEQIASAWIDGFTQLPEGFEELKAQMLERQRQQMKAAEGDTADGEDTEEAGESPDADTAD